MNQTSRRNFVLTASLASGATMFGSIGSVFASAPSSSVSGLVSKYGTNISSRQLDAQTVEYRVKINSHENFAQIFGDQKRLAWDRVEALEGNVLKLTGRDQRVVILKHV